MKVQELVDNLPDYAQAYGNNDREEREQMNYVVRIKTPGDTGSLIHTVHDVEYDHDARIVYITAG